MDQGWHSWIRLMLSAEARLPSPSLNYSMAHLEKIPG